MSHRYPMMPTTDGCMPFCVRNPQSNADLTKFVNEIDANESTNYEYFALDAVRTAHFTHSDILNV